MVELKSFLKKWRKGVKKYNAKLISEIYEHIQDSDNVGDDYRYLIESGYFQSVLWDLFDRNDTVSDTHLELIAKLVIFDLEVPDPGASRGLLSLLLSEREKFNEYMVAITRLCEVGRPLVTCLLQLLYVFHCSGNEHVLQWFINKTSFRFLTGYGQSEEPLDSIDGTKFFFDCLIKQAQPAVSRCLNKLLVACLCKKSELRDTLLELLRETAFTLDDYIVRYYLYYSENADGDERSQKFTKLQLTVQAYIENKEESTGSDNSLKWFTLVPSIYDLNLEEATEFLLGLPNDLLKDMCKELDICQHLPAALLARYHETVVAKIVDELHFGLSFDLLQNIKSDINSLNNTEKEVSTDLIPSFFSLSLHDFIFKTFMNYSRDFRTQVGAHLDQVLKRLSISNEGAASGTSKYATSIKSRTQGDSSDTSILVLSKNISTSVGEVILLVEILKPNKYGSTDLVQKYGVTDMKWATVLGQKGNSISIKVDSPINDETFNWAIRIPETIGNPWKLFLDEPKKVAFLSLPQVLYNAFMGGEVADLDLTNRSFDFYCKDVLSLLNKVYPDMVIEHENSTKRIKIDSSNEFQEHGDISALRVNFGHSERTAIPIASRSNSDTLSISSMRALISVLAGGLTTIETLPHSNLELVNTIIFHLRTNFPLERILVCSSTQNIPSSLFLSGDLKEDQVILNNTIADLKRLSQTLIGKINIFSDTESVTIEEATVMLTSVESRWLTFLQKVKHDPTVKSLKDYPFHTDFEPEEGGSFESQLEKIVQIYLDEVVSPFTQLKRLAPLFKLQSNQLAQQRHLVNTYSNVIEVLPRFLTNELSSGRFLSEPNIHTVILPENQNLSQFESLLPFYFVRNAARIIVMGNTILNKESLITKLISNEAPAFGPIEPEVQTRKEITNIFRKENHNQEDEEDSDEKKEDSFNPGFNKVIQFVETSTNLEEAEYVVSVYQYMILLGYPENKIGIIAASPLQQYLINEVLSKKVPSSIPKFIKIVSDKLSGSVDYILMSLHGSTSYLIDYTRASTISRLGLYIFSPTEYIPIGFDKTTKLKIRIGETFTPPTKKRSKQVFPIESYEHMSHYVEQMKKKKH